MGSAKAGAALAELVPPPSSDCSAIAPRPTPHSLKNQRRAGEADCRLRISDCRFEEDISFQFSVVGWLSRAVHSLRCRMALQAVHAYSALSFCLSFSPKSSIQQILRVF